MMGRILLCLVVLGCQDSSKSDDGGTGGMGPADAAAGGTFGADAAPADQSAVDSPGTGGSGGAGGTAACGDQTCKVALDYCRVQYPGTGGNIGYSCRSRGGCDRCDCLQQPASCRCSQDPSGFITVTCQGL
jgi:hypothetical protein